MTRLQFAGILPAWLALGLAILGGIAIWCWYYRETRWIRSPWSVLLPTLRSLAFVLLVLMLAGPSMVRQWISGQLSRIAILIDESTSMELSDDPLQSSRLQRVDAWLTGTREQPGWLQRERSRFQLQLSGFADPTSDAVSIRPIWESSDPELESPPSLDLQGRDNRTAIGDALTQGTVTVSQAESISSQTSNVTAVVLLSDGQSNSGESPASVALRLQQRSIPILAIGYGRSDEPDDLGILSVDHARSIFPTDTFGGSVEIKQAVGMGEEYRIGIRFANRLIWSESMRADGTAIRKIDFQIPAERLFAQNAEVPRNRQKSIPLDIEFFIERTGGDAAPENDTMPSSLWGRIQKNRVLVMDPRGRWETRYIKNAFQRDTAWDLDEILGPAEFTKRAFPQSRDELAALDLMVISLDSITNLSDVQIKWIADHVAETGSGLIWIDSGRDPPPTLAMQSAVDWLPITMDPEGNSTEIKSLKLMDSAWNERTFSLAEDEESNRALWKALPPPRVARRVRLAAGAEVLVSGLLESNSEFPMIVTRRLGQGRVVYVANDESWRWRYNVADLYHQRFWNQLAQWTTQIPFAVENDFVALDSGDRTYDPKDRIPIRARLRNPDRSPMRDARVSAVVTRDAVRYDTLPLRESGEDSGLYAGTAGPYPSGNYKITLEVAGVPAETLELSTEWLVQSATDLERDALSQNRMLMQQIAQSSGGAYFDEQDADRVSDALSPFQTGRIEQSETLLWQSYPWFVAIMGLLAAEWFFRKRAGLV